MSRILLYLSTEGPLYAHEGSEAVTGDAAPNAHHSPSACCYSLNKLRPEPIVVTNTNGIKKSCRRRYSAALLSCNANHVITEGTTRRNSKLKIINMAKMLRPVYLDLGAC